MTEVRIRVNDTGDAGYVLIGHMTFEKGEHVLWNYEEIREWPDFKNLCAAGKVEVLDE
jgi:hypothetical protein